MKMIKNYKIFKESLLTKLEGPSEEEVEKNLRKRYEDNEISILDYYKKSKEYGLDIPYKEIEEYLNNINKSDEDLMDEYIKFDYYKGVIKLLDFGYDNFIGSYYNTSRILNILKENGDSERINEIFETTEGYMFGAPVEDKHLLLKLACAIDDVEQFDNYYSIDMSEFNLIIQICLNELSGNVLQFYFNKIKISKKADYDYYIRSFKNKIDKFIDVYEDKEVKKIKQIYKNITGVDFNNIKESLLNKLEGPSLEEISKNFNFELKFYTPEEFITDIINNMEVSEEREIETIWKKDGVNIIKLKDGNMLYIDVDYVWNILEKIYGLTTTETNVILRKMFSEYFGFRIVPMYHLGLF